MKLVKNYLAESLFISGSFFLRKFFYLAIFLVLIKLESVTAAERNINIQTYCGSDGTRNGTCPIDKGICSINPLANDIWKTEAY